jgi:hypothetical protein
MHVIYRKYLNDTAPPEVKGVIPSNVKAIKYVADKNREEKGAGGWYHWTSVETKVIKV